MSYPKIRHEIGKGTCFKDVGELEEGTGVGVIMLHYIPLWNS